jgi:hypothetical protein
MAKSKTEVTPAVVEKPTLNLETEIIWSAVEAVQDAIKAKLGAYNSPLEKMVNQVVNVHEHQIVALMNDAFKQAFSNEAFRAEVQQAFIHSLARNLMKEYSGEVEKHANALKQHPEFRARVVLAIEGVVTEFAVKK